MAVWDTKPTTLQKKRIYNLISQNDKILKRILNVSQKQLNQILKLYASNPEQLYNALQYWISGGTLTNPAYSNDIAVFTENIGTAYSIGLTMAGGTATVAQQVIKETMTDSIMNYVTKLDTDTKKSLAKTLTEGYDQAKFPKQIVEEMQKTLNNSKYKASMITHTETMRASNAANWSQSKVNGATYFTVDVRPGACKYCVGQLQGRVFSIDKTEYIPPIHPWCACVARYHTDYNEAMSDAQSISQRNKAKIAELKEKGYAFPKNGTGPLSPAAQLQRKGG